MVNLVAADVATIEQVATFPRRVRVVEDLRIPLSDGTRLSARMWIPEDAEADPVPAVIEYIPFRHRDFSAPRDQLIHPWFAGHGYASIRLETRGSQESDGGPMDEYVVQEQDDAVEALAWIAAQPWCSGTTGMFGMSWGAFSALQVAARRPPSLKAIIPVHGTDDRFMDDIHFKGGCLLTANLSWGWLYFLYMMRPPDPLLVGDEWRDIWRERIEKAPSVLEHWTGEQEKSAYWRHASVRENYDDIEAATYVMCGWVDGYSNAAVRMANGIKAPCRTLIGPWAHTYPHIAMPGPQIGFLQEATRWWDRWLKGIDNGMDREPRLTFYMQDPAPPATSRPFRDGRWIGTDCWPPRETENVRYAMNPGRLDTEAAPGAPLTLKSPLANAMSGGEWLPHGVGPELPPDQREEDAGSLCFDSAVLEHPIEICGAPIARLRIRTDTRLGNLTLRVCDVAPDGTSSQITYGLLNLAHRNGFDRPEPMEPGAWMDVSIAANDIAQHVPAGHRIRVSVSTESFPLIWPAPERMTVVLDTSGCRFDLPVWPAEAPDDPVPDFAKPTMPPPLDMTWLRPVARERTIERDLVADRWTRTYIKDDGAFRIEAHGMTLDTRGSLKYSCQGDDPLSAKAELHYTIANTRGNWSTKLEGVLTVTADLDALNFMGHVDISEDGTPTATRKIDERVPRRVI